VFKSVDLWDGKYVSVRKDRVESATEGKRRLLDAQSSGDTGPPRAGTSRF